MAKRGPQSKHVADKINLDELKKLCAMQCTDEEIAAWFGCSVDTLSRNFADIIKEGRQRGRISMKRALFDKVQKGDLGAIVWWGKNYAGMSDKIEQKQHIELKEVKYDTEWGSIDPTKKDT